MSLLIKYQRTPINLRSLLAGIDNSRQGPLRVGFSQGSEMTVVSGLQKSALPESISSWKSRGGVPICIVARYPTSLALACVNGTSSFNLSRLKDRGSTYSIFNPRESFVAGGLAAVTPPLVAAWISSGETPVLVPLPVVPPPATVPFPVPVAVLPIPVTVVPLPLPEPLVPFPTPEAAVRLVL